jgi:hypothetical protein
MTARELFSFPDPVNEVSARLVAGGVVLLGLAALVFDLRWLVPVLAYGFVARALSGPTLSPLGQFVTRVVTPRLGLEPRYVSGPPKRFAQATGAVFTLAATVLTFGFHEWGAAQILLGILVVFATLESVFAFCVGCKVFAILMRVGLVPSDVCERCNDIWTPRRA